MDSPESEATLLLALLAARPVAAEALAEADWDALIALAQHHGVAPLLYHGLKKGGLLPSPEVTRQLRTLYLASVTRNTRLFHELGKILRALRAADVPVILLKGACLAEAVYGNLALRPMGDVDLLVKPDDLVRALDILYGLGYTAERPFDLAAEQAMSHHVPALSKSDGLTIELHWTIVHSRYEAQFTPADLDQLWDRAQPITVQGVVVQMFSPADLLLHLCLHVSVHHRFDGVGLRAYVDVAQVCQRYGETLDWEQFAVHANRWGIARGVRLALQLAEEWAQAAIPATLWPTLEVAPLDSATLDWVRQKILSGSSLSLQSEVAQFEGQAHWADKLRVLSKALFPSRVEMACRYPAPANSWRILCYYPVRFTELWSRYFPAMWHLLRRDPTLVVEARQEARLRDYLGWS